MQFESKFGGDASVSDGKIYIVAGQSSNDTFSDKLFVAEISMAHTFTPATGEGDTDNPAFTIAGNELKLNESADFETQNEYTIRVKGTDPGGLSIEKAFTVTVTDVYENQAPVGLTLDNNTIAENSPADTTIGTLTAIDPDEGDTHAFTLTDPAQHPDNDHFTIEGDQLKAAAIFDFEAKASYTLNLKVADADGLVFTQEIEIMVTDVADVNTAPVIRFLTASLHSQPGYLVNPSGHEPYNHNAFAALKEDGSVVIWGDSDRGGDSSSVSSKLTSGVKTVFSTGVPLRRSKRMVQWSLGDILIRAAIPAVSPANSHPVLKPSSQQECLCGAQRGWFSGHLGTFGFGRRFQQVSSKLASGVKTVFNRSAFAALKEDGSVVTWGHSDSGGDSSSVSSKSWHPESKPSFLIFMPLLRSKKMVRWSLGDVLIMAAIPALSPANSHPMSKPSFLQLMHSRRSKRIVRWSLGDILIVAAIPAVSPANSHPESKPLF